MLPEAHPHAWDVAHAHAHLPVDFGRRYLPKGGRLVVTPQMRQLAATMPTALDRGAAIAVSGPVGAGKSTTLAAIAAVADVNTAVVNIPHKATEKAQWEEIATTVTGQPATGTARTMQNTVREYLTAVPTLLIVDEAQYIGLPAMLQLRWLWAHPFPRFAIVLAGSGLDTHLDAEPSVGSRIDIRINLRHHPAARMLTLLQAHHPLAAATDPALLEAIDSAYAKGSWRAWSKFLLFLANDVGHTGPITRDIAEAAILAITGTPPALRSGPAPHNRTGRTGRTGPLVRTDRTGRVTGETDDQ